MIWSLALSFWSATSCAEATIVSARMAINVLRARRKYFCCDDIAINDLLAWSMNSGTWINAFASPAGCRVERYHFKGLTLKKSEGTRRNLKDLSPRMVLKLLLQNHTLAGAEPPVVFCLSYIFKHDARAPR